MCDGNLQANWAVRHFKGGVVKQRKSRSCVYLPWDVGLPAAPCLTEVLQDGARLVLLDALGHHVQDVVHHGCPELQVKVGLNALLGDLQLPGQHVETQCMCTSHDVEATRHSTNRGSDASSHMIYFRSALGSLVY